MSARIIVIEGIIGAGKSTLAKVIGQALGLHVMEESVDSNPYLDLFYEDPKRYAFPMQMHMLMRRHAQQQEASWRCLNGAKGVILDRSLPGDRVFAKLHRDEGNISQLEWETYEMAFDIMTNALIPPRLLVYLDVPVTDALLRIEKRGREAEQFIASERPFLDSLHEEPGLTHPAYEGITPAPSPEQTQASLLASLEAADVPLFAAEHRQRAKPPTVNTTQVRNRMVDGVPIEEPFSECPTVGVGGHHSDSYGEDGDGACAWCGATPKSTELTAKDGYHEPPSGPMLGTVTPLRPMHNGAGIRICGKSCYVTWSRTPRKLFPCELDRDHDGDCWVGEPDWDEHLTKDSDPDADALASNCPFCGRVYVVTIATRGMCVQCGEKKTPDGTYWTQFGACSECGVAACEPCKGDAFTHHHVRMLRCGLPHPPDSLLPRSCGLDRDHLGDCGAPNAYATANVRKRKSTTEEHLEALNGPAAPDDDDPLVQQFKALATHPDTREWAADKVKEALDAPTGLTDDEAKDIVLMFDCPVCAAVTGERCIMPAGPLEAMYAPHGSRVELAKHNDPTFLPDEPRRPLVVFDGMVVSTFPPEGGAIITPVEELATDPNPENEPLSLVDDYAAHIASSQPAAYDPKPVDGYMELVRVINKEAELLGHWPMDGNDRLKAKWEALTIFERYTVGRRTEEMSTAKHGSGTLVIQSEAGQVLGEVNPRAQMTPMTWDEMHELREKLGVSREAFDAEVGRRSASIGAQLGQQGVDFKITLKPPPPPPPQLVDWRYLEKLSAGYLAMLTGVDSGRHAWSRGMEVLRTVWADRPDGETGRISPWDEEHRISDLIDHIARIMEE
jgi:deoxyadenosine/deoxycytidine kinase